MSLYGYGFDRRRHARAVPWQGLLRAATTEEEVVTAVRDYIALFTPDEIATLPPPCRPGRIVDGADVNEYAFVLAQHQFLQDPLAVTPLKKLSTFMTSASLQLSRVLARPAGLQ